jgi:hypothetical protein
LVKRVVKIGELYVGRSFLTNPKVLRPAQACPGLPRPAQLVKPWRSLKGTLRKP